MESSCVVVVRFGTLESVLRNETGLLVVPEAVRRALVVGGDLWIQRKWKEMVQRVVKKQDLVFDAIRCERCDGCCCDGSWERSRQENEDLVAMVKERLLQTSDDAVQGIRFVQQMTF